jgi:membrane-associated PAP2 superfamily phosphatase
MRGSAWRRRFWLLHIALPITALLLVLAAVEASGLDWWLSDLFFDSRSRSFPLRGDPFLEHVLHYQVKYVVIAVALTISGAWLVSYTAPRLARYRRVLMFVWLAMVLSTSAISGLKALSGKHCPYDLAIYGGWAPYRGLMESLPDGVAPGHCFPGGHASTGFSLFAIYFAALHLGRRRLAAAALAVAFLLGLTLGMGRVAQGAHFLSHSIWTALICWAVIALLYLALLFPATERKRLNPNAVSV